MLLCDCDIRTALKKKLIEEYIGTQTIIVDELPICWGDSRIDIAVVNCRLNGYEIKSDRDTLERLPHQVELYNKIFDSITLVCSQKLISKALGEIPEWWGILIPVFIDASPDGIVFETVRNPQPNEDVDLRRLVELTWKEEAINILDNYGLARGFRSRPRWDIWDHMVKSIDPNQLKESVRNCLRDRQEWRKPETLQRLYVD